VASVHGQQKEDSDFGDCNLYRLDVEKHLTFSVPFQPLGVERFFYVSAAPKRLTHPPAKIILIETEHRLRASGPDE